MLHATIRPDQTRTVDPAITAANGHLNPGNMGPGQKERWLCSEQS
jgi:hypothetical protein